MSTSPEAEKAKNSENFAFYKLLLPMTMVYRVELPPVNGFVKIFVNKTEALGQILAIPRVKTASTRKLFASPYESLQIERWQSFGAKELADFALLTHLV